MGRVLGAILRFLGGLIIPALVVVAAFATGVWTLHHGPAPATTPPARLDSPPAPVRRPRIPVLNGLVCLGPATFIPAAAQNGASLNTLASAPFGVPETGWAIYAPLIAREIGTSCAPDAAGFAEAFSRWQSAHAQPATGRVDAPALSSVATLWLLRRPFVRAMKDGCPAPPLAQALAVAAPADSFGGKTLQARPAVLDAYRRMVAAARQEIAAPAPLLTIASAYRGPEEETARCADGGCGNPYKAHCSAHRTGLALDLYLGAAPGQDPFSTSDQNRLYQSRTPAYAWLVRHADQYGFVPYPFEPWHWEWTGEGV